MLNDDVRMQILISDATDLKTHLKEDGFFNCGDTLHIIDNYNILNIKPKAIDFYEKNFSETGCRNIIFYMEVENMKKINKSKDLSSMFPIELLYFFKKALGNSCGIKELLFNLETQNYNELLESLEGVINFMERMKNKGINVYIQLYKLKKADLKFHGRYWLSSLKDNFVGYMVDGSLNTYPTSMILAQLLNDDNHDILREMIYLELKPGCSYFKQISFDDLNRFKRLAESIDE